MFPQNFQFPTHLYAERKEDKQIRWIVKERQRDEWGRRMRKRWKGCVWIVTAKINERSKIKDKNRGERKMDR